MKIPKTVFVVIHKDDLVYVAPNKKEASAFIARWGFEDVEIVKYKHLPKERISEDN